MAAESKEIRVIPVGDYFKTWLCLQGTMLAWRRQGPGHESSLEIPVELISVTAEKRFSGKMLVAAVFSLLASLVGVLVSSGLFLLLVSGFDAEPSIAVIVCNCAILAVGILLGFYFLVRFLLRQQAVVLHIAPDNVKLSFWLEKEQEAEIQELLTKIEKRKPMVRDTMTCHAGLAQVNHVQPPWKRTLILTFLCAVPGLMTEIPWLLLACIVPVGMHIGTSIRGAGQPPEYRKAMRHYFKRDWAGAKNAIIGLVERNPSYLPARVLLVELLMWLDDFRGAESALAEIQDVLDTEKLQSMQEEIIVRERIFERKRHAIGME